MKRFILREFKENSILHLFYFNALVEDIAVAESFLFIIHFDFFIHVYLFIYNWY